MQIKRWPVQQLLQAVGMLAALAFAGVGLALPPDLSPLRFLPGDDALGPAAGKQWSPEIAAGNGTFLAVWVDDRSSINVLPENLTGGAAFDNYNGSMLDIYAARLDAQGNVIDTTPMVVGQQKQNQALPDVAWNGQNWLVVWSGEQGISCCPDINVYAARVSPNGVLLDNPPIVVDTDNTNNGLYWPAVSSDGTNWVVVWRDLDAAAGIFTLDGARISPAGVVLDPGGVRLRRDTHNSYPVDPDLAFAGDEFLMTWTEDSGEVKGQLLSPSLQPIGPVFQINAYSPTTGLNPRVATNGTDFLVAYWEDRYFGWSELRVARVNHAGQLLDPQAIPVTQAYGYTNYDPAVAWEGQYYFVVFDKDAFQPDIHAARVSPQGSVLDFGGFPVSVNASVQNEAAVAPLTGGGVVALWKDYRNPSEHPGDIYGALVTRGGQAGADFPVSLGRPRQTELDLAEYPGGYLAAYRSETALGARILAQRVNLSGFAIDPQPVEVASGSAAIHNPGVAWNGSVFLVVWEDGTQVFGRRLGSTALPLGAAFPVLPGEMPHVAANGDHFLVVSSHEDPHEIRQIKAVRVRGVDGVVLDTPMVIGPNFSKWPRASALAGRWLVVYERYPTHDNPRSNILATFVEPSGAFGTYLAVHTDAISPSCFPDVDEADGVALIVWEDSRTQPEFEDLYGRRIDAAGVFLDPGAGLAVSTNPNEQYEPYVAWDGTYWNVIHGDNRQDHMYAQHRGDIYATLLRSDVQPMEPEGFPVANDTIPEVHPAVEATEGHVLFGGSILRWRAPYGAYRIGFRVIDASESDVVENGVPGALRIAAAPNPASGPLTFWLDLPAEALADAAVFDLTGRLVRRLNDSVLSAGSTPVLWDGRDAAGRLVPAGLYFARLRAGGEERVLKLTRR